MNNNQKQQIIPLCGDWTLESADQTLNCPVKIPGSVLSAVTEQGILDDPYDRMNEYQTREYLDQDFVFFRTFQLEKQDGMTYELCCDGIDTVADITINGILVQKADNMHRQYRIQCTHALKNGTNELRIAVYSAIRAIRAYIPQPGKEIRYTPCGAMEHNQYLRKAHSMFGWDWGPQLPDLGIFREIYLRGYTEAVLEDIRFRQDHKYVQCGQMADTIVQNGSKADTVAQAKSMADSIAQEGSMTDSIMQNRVEAIEVYAEPYLKLAGGERCTLAQAKEQNPQLDIRMELVTPDGETLKMHNGSCTVEDPQLWWPNRYGSQPLYTVRAELLCGGQPIQEKQYRIGLRTLTVSRGQDAWGEEFAFCVNGVKIFAKGANYIPQDCMYSKITPERIRSLLDTAADCGFNCIRVWGGGYYPSDAFYDYCDEKGLIIWQDFMYACNIYELTDAFRKSILAETTDNVRRLRHHASLGLWCGNNEMESAWDHWGGFCDHPQALREDYLEMFEKIIPDVVQQEDGVTFYWPSSPSSGGSFREPDSDDRGDRHYWDVWHGEKPFTDYENYYFRFCSEFGFQSFPSMKTIQAFTRPTDRNIFSEVMESHQKNGAANGKILRYISDNFLYPKDLESLVYVSQVLQGLAIKEGVEHWRRNRGRCMGAIYWQLNDNWPVASWSGVDYYGRWKALQYMARHFYADLLGSLQETDTYAYTPYVQNETRKKAYSEITLYVKDMQGNVLYQKNLQAACAALSVTAVETVYLQDIIKGKERYVFVEAVFSHSDGTVSHQIRTPKPFKHMQIPKTVISCTGTRSGNLLSVTLHSQTPAFFAEVETDADLVWSDNFMHLTDGKEHTVTAQLPQGYEGMPQLRVRSLCDSYEFA